MFKRMMLVGLSLGLVGGMTTAQEDAKETKPVLTVQVQSISKVLADAREIVREVKGEKAVKRMDDAIKEGLGEQGFSGIDTMRPFAGRLYITGAIKDENDLDKLKGIIVVPITNPDDFKTLLKKAELEIRESKETKGLYTLLPPNAEDAPPMQLRFDDRYAYLSVNGPIDGMLAKALPNVTDLIDLREPGLFSYRGSMDAYPEAFYKESFGQWDQMRAQLGNMGISKKLQKSIAEAFKWYEEISIQAYTQGDMYVARLYYERSTKDIVGESVMTAKPNTEMAKYFANLKPNTNQFAGMIQKDATAGVLFSLPITVPELQNVIGDALDEMAAEIKQSGELNADMTGLFDAAHQGLVRTVRSGGFDYATQLTGPDSDGLFSASSALTFDDPSKVEAELKKFIKKQDEGVQSLVELDAAKVGNVNIHKINVGPLMPFEIQNVFGEKAAVCVAFAPKAIYVTFGSDAVATMKVALVGKAGPAPGFDSFVNHAKMQKYVASFDADAGNIYELAAGTEDKRVTIFAVETRGGENLTVRTIMNVQGLPKLIAGFVGMGSSGPLDQRQKFAAPAPPQPIPVRKQ